MLKVTLKNLLGHKLRVAITAVAIVAGVSFMAGSFVLTDTITRTFDDLFSDANLGVDAVVRQAASFEVESSGGPGSDQAGAQRDDVPIGLVDRLRKVDGVRAAEASVQGVAIAIGPDDKPINSLNGAPQFGANWLTVPTMTPYELAAGRAPEGPDQVVIDRGTAKRADLGVGDRLRVQTLGPTLDAKIAGIATFGDTDNFAGASFVLMDTVNAARFFGREGMVQLVQVQADPGVSRSDLVERLGSGLPDGLEVVNASTYIAEQQDDVQEGFSVFGAVLSGFATVSLIAGAFLIYNIFGIVVAQRTRELALLRAIGASRSQVRRSVLVEAVVTGLIASLVGLVAGLGLAVLLTQAMAALGLDLPSTSIVVAPRTVIVSVLAGLIVTVISALIPARRAARVSPMAAIRDVAYERTGRAPVRLVIGIAVGLFGAASLVRGATDHDFVPVLVGVVALFVSVVVLGPLLAPPVGRALGAWLPAVKGLTGRLARENAVRNPRRTAATTTALVLALTLVSVLTIFFTSFTASINAAVAQGFKGDFQLDSGSFGIGGLSPQLADRVSNLPEVSAAAGLRTGTAAVDGDGTAVWGADGPELDQVLDIGIDSGALSRLRGVRDVAVEADLAREKQWKIGSRIQMQFPDGRTRRLRVVATYTDDGLIGQGAPASYLLALPAFARYEPAQAQTDIRVLVKAAEGVSDDDARRAVETVTDDYPVAKVQDLSEIQKNQTRQINQGLSFLLVLLALTVVIGFLGIAITLALSVIERTRELGLLRAVGMERRQLRSVVRWEAVLIALLGTVLGLAVGVAGGSALAMTLRGDIETARVDVPVLLLLVFCLVAAGMGVIAAILPAWWASRLDVLRAVTVE